VTDWEINRAFEQASAAFGQVVLVSSGQRLVESPLAGLVGLGVVDRADERQLPAVGEGLEQLCAAGSFFKAFAKSFGHRHLRVARRRVRCRHIHGVAAGHAGGLLDRRADPDHELPSIVATVMAT
jgi:hypothetical protein